MKVFACYNTNEEVRMKSSSGGIFSLLATQILSEDGVIYGVAMAEDCYSAEFIRVLDESGLERLRGSKYLQARMGDTFSNVKKDLMAGRKVLFSGTGCQVNGLKKFLQKEYDNLLCVDVICHGAPSPALWEKYVKYQESKHGKLIDINFRCKDDSWIDFGMKENTVYISKDVDSFMQMFLRDYCLRPSCYECVAKDIKMSDITIADFWGIERVSPEMNDNKGTSLAIVRSKKGEEIFSSIKDGVKMKEVSYKDAVKGNPSEYCSVKRPEERGTFFVDMNNMEFGELEKKYAAPIPLSFKSKVKRKIKQILRKFSGGGERMFWQSYGMMFTFQNKEMINGDTGVL